MQKISVFLFGILLLTIAGCSRPEGPAERLGKTIDQLNQNLQDMAQDFDNKNAEEERVRERERSRVREDYYGSDRESSYDRNRDTTTQDRY